MNKYTLTFKDPKLQKLYSKDNPLSKKVLQIISIAGLFTCGIDFIQQYATYEQIRFLLSLGFTSYFLLQLFLISLSEKVVPLGIFITNMIVAAIELYLNEKYNAYNGYLYGSNQMLIHSLLIYISSYRMSIVSSIVLAILKVLFTTMRTDHMTFFQISYTACATITFLYINYEFEKQKRTLFLTNLREKAKDIIFPKIIDKPYFIFERDPETMQLQIKYSEQVVELEGFLDEARINGMTLKQKLYQIIKTFQNKEFPFYEEKIKIRYEKERHNVTFQIFNLEQTFYSLSLNTFNQQFQQLNQQHKVRMQQLKHKFRDILSSIGTLSTQIILSKNVNLAIKLRVSELQLGIIAVNHKQVKNININDFIQDLINYFTQLKLNLKMISSNNISYNMDTVPHYLLLLMFEIIKQINIENHVRFIIAQDEQNMIKISVTGVRIPAQTSLLLRCKQILIHHFLNDGNTIHLTFLETPNISFLTENVKVEKY